MTLPRYGTVEEIADMVAYRASPEAGFITGANLMIDGGFSAQKQGARQRSLASVPSVRKMKISAALNTVSEAPECLLRS